ncbi:hypothetical protein ACHAW6_012161 [Cyclotella cf. meneghiniana]
MSTFGEADTATKAQDNQDDAVTDSVPQQQHEHEHDPNPLPTPKLHQAPPPPEDVVAPHPPPTQPHEPHGPPRPPVSGSPEDLGRTWSETIFPMKLYDILCNPEFHHAVSWMPHGRSWKVLNKEFFMEEICPQYFAQTRYESFIRQVNGWGFKRMRREGPDRSSYYHEHFLRGYPNLIDHMRRPAPGEKTRDMREEPDFYAATPMPQLPPSVIPSAGGGVIRAGKLSKVGRPAGSLNGIGGAVRGSFDAVPQRGEYPGPYGHGPYMMPPGASPWGPPPYYPYPPPPGYWGQHPPQSSPWRGGAHPPPPPHGHYSYPPVGWGPPHHGPGGQPTNGPPPPPPPPMGYPYPPGMFDPNYYGGYPPHPSTPQHGGRAREDSIPSGSKRDREENPEDDNGESPNKRHYPPHPPPMPNSGPPPPPHMGYYYPPAHMFPGEMIPMKEEGGEENGSFGPGPPGDRSRNQQEATC